MWIADYHQERKKSTGAALKYKIQKTSNAAWKAYSSGVADNYATLIGTYTNRKDALRACRQNAG